MCTDKLNSNVVIYNIEHVPKTLQRHVAWSFCFKDDYMIIINICACVEVKAGWISH